MDRTEFNEKYEEIRQLIAKGKKDDALDLADSINWRKVHNVNSLVRISEVYVELGELEDAKDMLYIAHERSPIGRTILYHLALLCVQTGELEEAEGYYSDFVNIAPHDSLKYVIKYQINKAKGTDDATLIAILEELKTRDFLEEWAYELAYLYHRTMQVEKCVDLCDELILWYGDGPYVERAMEMKMIYQPLTEGQQSMYRQFQNRREGLTEIQANEFCESGEIIPKTIAIPQVTFNPERFNTINLQAEIKRNIDEIMNATEAEVVNENVENIKSLVEEIPYLQMKPTQETIALELETSQKVDAAIMDTFQEYLAEENDGQISLLLPDEKETEEQIEGQMTIDDVIAEWEKTKRAAEAALQEAEQQKLEAAKNIALMEAGQLISQLEAINAELERSQEQKSEGPARESVVAPVPVPAPVPEIFTIPKVAAGGAAAGVGLEVPVVHLPEGSASKSTAATPIVAKAAAQDDTAKWEPPHLEEGESADDEITDIETTDAELVDTESVDESTVDTEPQVPSTQELNYEEATRLVEDINNSLQKEIDRLVESDMFKEEEVPLELESEIEAEINPELESELEPVEEADFAPALGDAAFDDFTVADITSFMNDEELMPELEIAPELENEPALPVIADVQFTEDEIAEMVDASVVDQVNDEIPVKSLTDEQRALFSYFIPVAGMESQICQAITGIVERMGMRSNSATGNLVIYGGVGSDKTMLSTNIVKVLQDEEIGINGSIGKIDAEQLNQKDMEQLLAKINGGTLVVESAGDLSDSMMTELCLLLSRDNTNILVVLEDEKSRIKNLFNRDPHFASMFTEKVDIPIFSMDELVGFAQVYAQEEGYSLDAMAVLALHTRINAIQKAEGGTSLLEVRDIMDDAMDHAERGLFRGIIGRVTGQRYDEEGNLILREQDFEE